MGSDTPEDRDTDRFFHEVREAFIQRTDRAFDFDAGLADVLARAKRDRPGAAADPAPPTWRPSAVAAVCAQADRLASVLGLLDREAAPWAFDHLQRARELVFAFRAALSTADRPSHERLEGLLRRVADHLDAADGLLRSQGSTSLRKALQARLSDLGPIPLDPHGELQTLQALTDAILQDSTNRPVRSSRRPTARHDQATDGQHGD